MTRTPLSIVREAKDFLRTSAFRRPGSGLRQYSSQSNLATVDLNSADPLQGQTLRKGPKRLPSLSNVTQGGYRPPSPPRSNKPRNLRNRTASVPTLTPLGVGAPPDQPQFWCHAQPTGTASRHTVAGDVFRQPVDPLLGDSFGDPLFGRRSYPTVEVGGSEPSSAKRARDVPTEFSRSPAPQETPKSSRWQDAPKSSRSSHAQGNSPTLAFPPSPAQRLPLIIDSPNGDGALPDWLLLPKPLEVDHDGDEAHEFWEEDRVTGVLMQVDPNDEPPFVC